MMTKLKGRYDDPGFAMFQRLYPGLDDFRRNVVRYELTDGRMIEVDASAVKERGLAAVMREAGVEMPAERVPVFQGDQKVGTLPPDFDPLEHRSRSLLYDMRPGDFSRTDSGWRADPMLGFGDLEMVRGFVFEPPYSSRGFSPD